jgi:hypothetical protein
VVRAWLGLSCGRQRRRGGETVRRIVGSVERVNFPIEFVRSMYFLGQITERAGDTSKARDYYRRFVTYWGDGDIDREHVAEAKKKLTLK